MIVRGSLLPTANCHCRCHCSPPLPISPSLLQRFSVFSFGFCVLSSGFKLFFYIKILLPFIPLFPLYLFYSSGFCVLRFVFSVADCRCHCHCHCTPPLPISPSLLQRFSVLCCQFRVLLTLVNLNFSQFRHS
jgi:hypothetical protein